MLLFFGSGVQTFLESRQETPSKQLPSNTYLVEL